MNYYKAISSFEDLDNNVFVFGLKKIRGRHINFATGESDKGRC